MELCPECDNYCCRDTTLGFAIRHNAAEHCDHMCETCEGNTGPSFFADEHEQLYNFISKWPEMEHEPKCGPFVCTCKAREANSARRSARSYVGLD